MTALTLDFWVSIPVPPPSSRVTLADFLFLPLCHGDDNTGQGGAGSGTAGGGLGPPTDGDSGPGLSSKADPRHSDPWGSGQGEGASGESKGGFLKKPASQSQLRMPSSGSRSRPGRRESQAPWPLGPRAESQGAIVLLATEAGQAQHLGGCWQSGSLEREVGGQGL